MEKYKNKNWLYKKINNEKLSISEIAKQCGVAVTTISRWAAKFKLRKIGHHNVDRHGSRNPYWNGGRYKDRASGYILVYSPDHPFRTKKGYVLEHRLVVERSIKRHLRSNEIIHHKNKIKDDNRKENLEIIVLGEPNSGMVRCPFCNKGFKVK